MIKLNALSRGFTVLTVLNSSLKQSGSVFTARCIVDTAVLRLHVVRPSICPSVTLVDQDHIGWKSWKLIAWTISPTHSLFVAQRPPTYFQGNMEKFGVGWEKVACWSTKASISLKRERQRKSYFLYRLSIVTFPLLCMPTLVRRLRKQRAVRF